MPKIIKNGVTYIGTSDNAAAVSYDNTSSGLTATNAQGAIDEVNSGLADKMDKVNPTGSGHFSFNATATSGTRNVNLCYGGTVIGSYNFAGGYGNSFSSVTVVIGDEETTYIPSYDAVFGRSNTIEGGSYNIVAGRGNTNDPSSYCSLFGYGLKSSSNYQHICGRWNKTLSGVVEVVGWGSSDSNRANIRTLSTAGNEVLAGTIEATGLGATLKQAVIDAIYPVGSIYMTVADDTAAKVKARFGGTWVAWGKGRVPLGMGSNGTTNYTTVEATGGAERVLLDSEQVPLPEHTHTLSTLNLNVSKVSGTEYGFATGATFKGDVVVTQNTGTYKSAALKNATISKTSKAPGSYVSLMQPYITCYMWKRTA